MKNLIAQLTFVIVLFTNCTSVSSGLIIPLEKQNRTFLTKESKPHLIGQTTINGLKSKPFDEWYSLNYNQYEVNQKHLTAVKSKFKDITIKVFMATWCGDSRREVPHFIKIMDFLQFPKKQLNIVNLYLDSPRYKQSIDSEEEGLNIHRVPTFIFYKGDKEIGRIVESPINSLEIDIAQILLGIPSRPKYRAVTAFDKIIKEKGVDYLVEHKKELAQRTRYTVSGSYELNTYGYVLLSTQNKAAAVAIFEINTLAFPKNANVFDSLAEGYIAINEPALAMENYKKVLELDKKNEQAIRMLNKLEEEQSNGGS